MNNAGNRLISAGFPAANGLGDAGHGSEAAEACGFRRQHCQRESRGGAQFQEPARPAPKRHQRPRARTTFRGATALTSLRLASASDASFAHGGRTAGGLWAAAAAQPADPGAQGRFAVHLFGAFRSSWATCNTC